MLSGRFCSGFGALLVVCALTRAAIAGGPGDFTPHGTQPGLTFPLDGSSDCRGCHDGFTNDVNRRFLPSNTWGGSMMAHGTRDPLFWAALDVANNDLPGVGEWCLRCHTPQAWLEGRVKGVAGGAQGCALTGSYDANDDYGNDFAGVGCHLCHRQVAPLSPIPAPARHDSGNLFVDDSSQCGEFFGPCRYGPYRYPEAGILSPPHPHAFSPFVKQGEFCGSCHDVTTPIIDGVPARTLILSNGANTGIPYPIERTFSEWRASSYGEIVFVDGFADREPAGEQARYGRTCQSCHMPHATSNQAFACQQNDPGSRAGNLRVHEFAGSNVWMMNVIKNLYGAALDRVADIEQTIQIATDMMTNQAASMALSLDPFAGAGNNLTARVRITNLAGHKLPTGYAEGRRMWINLQARDANGALIFESAAYDDASAVLTEDAQAKVYEAQQGIWDGGTSTCKIKDAMNRKIFHFTLNNCVAKDNRIPPLGFRGGTDLEIQPVGYVYPETSPGSGVLVNYDDTVYTIPVPPGTPLPISVRAQLKHQVASKEYIEFLSQQATDHSFPSENTLCAPRTLSSGPRTQTRAAFMADQWAASGKSPPLLMQERQVSTATR